MSSLLAIVAYVISPRLPTRLPASTLLLATRATLLKGVGLPRTALSWTALALAPERLVIALAPALALCLPRSNVKISFNIDSCWNDSVNVHENSMLNTALQPVQYAAIQTLQEPYFKNGSHQPPPPGLLVDGEEEFEVEEILAHEPKSKTKADNRVKFLVKWKHFGHENNTWEPFKNIKNAPDSLKEYWDRVAVQVAQPRSGNGSGVAPNGRMAPVSKRLRRR